MSGIGTSDKRLELATKEEQEFINSFFALFRTARVYEPNNSAYITQSTRVYDGFRRLIDRSVEITIKTHEGRILYNGKLVKFNSDALIGATYVIDSWRLLGMGGVILSRQLDNRQIDKFIYLISKLNVHEGGYEAVTSRIKELGIDGITVLAVEEQKDDTPLLPEEEKKRMRKLARVTFFRSLSVVEEVMAHAKESKDQDITKARRVVHSLIDQLAYDESYLLQLTALRDFDEYTYVHSTNICIYALTMGIRLGLDRQRLSHLGFGALFHDLGKIKLPGDLIRKPDVFDENDWIQMQRHPEQGVKTIFRNMELNECTARAAVTSYGHHINEDFTGYPTLRKKRPTNLFAKIVSIADTFDALSSGRVYIKKEIPHDEILRKMMYQMSSKFDTFLLKLFVNIMGMFPPGSLVLLSTRELALVAENNEKDISRPKIRLIGNENGPYQQFLDIDLSQPDQEHRQIERMVDPKQYNIDTKAVILIDD